ncbi:alpha/beta hydrolase [Agromyces aurantiacus]|uniref:Alpha/beta hydrolase n=1 Tax=Agromyces aurantiacus TaxID=165814 RepID=A0ABV9R5J0_9MICO|nr:alpha/beta hydrolase [Agromyces aurantiacus]MBM7503283.1 alpha-beta hydrolase superfamily lysophospholipase [Agromyces aurantiacus]
MDWRPDVLGEGFEQLTLPLEPDDEGEVVATLVRYRPPAEEARPRRRWRWPWEPESAPTPPPAASGCDVLYVHGWSDYFFNPELARFWADAGARFYALELRKYGRSLREWQTPGYVTDLRAYDEDIEAALAAIVREHEAPEAEAEDVARPTRPLILLGHSTGGLVFSLWAARNPGRAAALILNSPWLEFQLRGIGRQAISPVIEFGARVNPMRSLPNVDLGFYARSVAKELDGEWEYDHAWRPDRGFPVHPAWLTAILAGHATVAAGIDVGVPVLTLLSARSALLPRWDDAMLTSDIVLVVDDIARQSLKLGPEVAISRLDGALHDVFLSREPARAAAYAAISRWLGGYAPRHD